MELSESRSTWESESHSTWKHISAAKRKENCLEKWMLNREFFVQKLRWNLLSVIPGKIEFVRFVFSASMANDERRDVSVYEPCVGIVSLVSSDNSQQTKKTYGSWASLHVMQQRSDERWVSSFPRCVEKDGFWESTIRGEGDMIATFIAHPTLKERQPNICLPIWIHVQQEQSYWVATRMLLTGIY